MEMDPTRISKEHAHCVRTLFGHQENRDLHDASFESQEANLMPESCRSVKQALQRAVQREVQRAMGRTPPRPEKGTRKVNLTSWHHDKGQANLSNMTFSDGKLIVNQDGFYYLYANICFRHHETSGNLTKRGLQLMVYVIKTNLKIRRFDVLMKGGSTKYWSGDSEFHFYSVNVGGFFKLKSGEMISIQMAVVAFDTIFPQSNPIQSNPIQSNPIQSNPIQSNPIQSNPIQSNPIQSNPIQSNPIQSKLL
ncbi:hypothetical protein IHE44_0005346, partial [Lamprotornis superbus]